MLSSTLLRRNLAQPVKGLYSIRSITSPTAVTTSRKSFPLTTPLTPKPNTTRFTTQSSIRQFHQSTSKMGVTELNSKQEFSQALDEQGSLIVLDCYATWCGPCKVISPQVEKFSDQYTSAKFYKLDVDKVPDVAEELSIRAMPTFLFFKDGEKFTEVVGANPKAIQQVIEQNV